MALPLFAYKNRKTGKALLPLLLCGLLLAAALGDYLYFRDRIYPGVYVKGTGLGGKTAAQAKESLEQMALHFTGPGGEKEVFSLKELGVNLNTDGIIADAFRRGRRSLPPWNYRDRLAIMMKPVHLPLVFKLEGNQLLQALDRLEETFNREADNAFFAVDEGEAAARLISEQAGRRLVRGELVHRLLHNLVRREAPPVVWVPLEIVEPEISAAGLQSKGITALMSSFTTVFDPANENRVHNIRLAASTIDGYFLAPGGVFSVNAAVGNTTPEKGYKKAPVIRGGELVPGYGGGLCQVSSTLYNAALLANLEIVERHNHALTVNYLPPGRDATVEYGAHDFRFRNNTGSYVWICAVVGYDTLTFRLFGEPVEEKVEINTRELAVFPPPVRYEFDPEMAPGEEEVIEGANGYIVEVIKTICRNNKLISEEIISRDHYAPHPTVIRRGPE